MPRPCHVILESPFAGDVADSLARGEAPLASHLLYTQPGILDDTVPEERRIGINAGLSWYDFAQASVVYVDRGISRGMQQGIDLARTLGVEVEYRQIGDNPTSERSIIRTEFERSIKWIRGALGR